MTAKIFLSYNREDAPVARRFAEAFEAEGLSVWWDATLRSGEAYDEVTEEALRTAKAVVVLWSPRSVTSRWVRAEATLADRNRTLVPVRIEPCDLPIMFELTQTADLSHWRGDVSDVAWRAFFADLRRKIGREPAESSAPAPHFDWGNGSIPPGVAVLPFAHRGEDDQLRFAAEDVTDEFTRQLAQNRLVRVIAAGTMASLRGKAADYRALGRDLAARYVVEGKLQRVGETIRLTLQIVDAGAASTIWSGRYARTAKELAASTDDWTAEIANGIGDQLVQIELNRAMNHPAPHAAWDHAMRAIAYSRRPGTDGARRGLEEARKAVAAAPEMGLAHALYAGALGVPVASHGLELEPGVGEEIRRHIERAMQLDGDNPEVISWSLTGYAALGEFETNVWLARRMLQIQPDSSNGQFWLGTSSSAVGRISDAIAALESYDRSASFDIRRPLALAILGMCYCLVGRLEQANAAIDRSLTLHPEFHMALRWKAVLAAYYGDEHKALATVRHLRQLEPNLTIQHHARSIAFTPHLEQLSVGALATLRRLWEKTEPGR